jgi:exosome complex RNA-binding protein Rrp4
VECILGNNGYVWVGYNPQKKQETDMIDTIVRGDTKIVRETV